MPFGQIVIGPPGSGKSTYCFGMQQFLGQLERKPVLVNLDPANDYPPYEVDIDIDELITLQQVMEERGLGPNGGMIYCIEHLAQNLESWLKPRLLEFKDAYFVIDCPGQVELYTHNEAMAAVVRFLERLDFRLVAVHMVDSHHVVDPSKFISVMILSLKTMMQMSLPHVNILSKLDLVETYGKLPLPLSYYTQLPSMAPILDLLTPDIPEAPAEDDSAAAASAAPAAGSAPGEPAKARKNQNWLARHLPLSKALCTLVEEHPYLSYYPLHIEDKESVAKIVRVMDKANGYVFGGLSAGNEAMLQAADRDGFLENVDRERALYHI